MPRTASTSPYRLVSPATSMTGRGPPAAPSSGPSAAATVGGWLPVVLGGMLTLTPGTSLAGTGIGFCLRAVGLTG